IVMSITPTLAGIEVIPEPQRPYVGAVPFQRSDEWRFFGREEEAEELAARIVAHPVLLLYGQSGVGKTSLINARLIPQLEREEECQVFEPVRVAGPIPRELSPGEIRNCFMFHALDRWKQRGQTSRQVAGLTLAHLLADAERPCGSLDVPAL